MFSEVLNVVTDVAMRVSVLNEVLNVVIYVAI